MSKVMNTLKKLSVFDSVVLGFGSLTALCNIFGWSVGASVILTTLIVVGFSLWWLLIMSHINTLKDEFEIQQDSYQQHDIADLEQERVEQEKLRDALDLGISPINRYVILCLGLFLSSIIAPNPYILVALLGTVGYCHTTDTFIRILIDYLVLIWNKLHSLQKGA